VARRGRLGDDIGDLAYWGGLAGLVYLGWRFASQGKLGPDLQRLTGTVGPTSGSTGPYPSAVGSAESPFETGFGEVDPGRANYPI
jgi:hypothetical protein